MIQSAVWLSELTADTLFRTRIEVAEQENQTRSLQLISANKSDAD